MADDKKYVDGVMVFAPHSKAPEFVVADVIISPKKLFEWLKGDGKDHLKDHETHGKQLKAVIKKGKNGYYMEVNDYVPGEKKKSPEPSDELPW